MKRHALVAAALMIGGCRPAAPATEIVVVVRTDVREPPLRSVRLAIERADGDGGIPLFDTCACAGEGLGCSPFPLTLGLAPETAPDGPFAVRADAFDHPACAGEAFVATSATVEFVAGRSLELDLDLLAACAGVRCATGTACVDASRLCTGDDRRGKLPDFSAWDGFAPLDLAAPTDAANATFGEAGIPDGGAPAHFAGVVPVSGPDTGGVALSLLGDHFVAPVAVRIDGILAADAKLVSPSRIDATLPADPGTCARVAVQIRNGDGQALIAPSGFTFLCPGGALLPAAPLATGLGAPRALAAADLDGDHRPDLLVPDGSTARLAVLRNLGGGAFGKAALTATGAPATAIGVGDFNEDGLLDVALAEQGAMGVEVLAGTGGGGLAAPIISGGLPASPSAMAIANFDGDAHLDVAASGAGANLASLLLGVGNLRLRAPVNRGAGVHPVALASGDLDGNALPDLVVANRDDASLTVLLDAGGDPPGKSSTWKLPDHPSALALADVDGDHFADLLVATTDEAAVLLLAGKGDGSFLPPARIAAVASTALAVGDIDGDGRPDLALADLAGGRLALLLGKGNRAFAAPAAFAVGKAPSAVVIFDADGDGRLDLAVLDAGSGEIYLLRNNTP